MNVNFKKYYSEYLGIDQNKLTRDIRIFSSDQRNIALNFKYMYKMVATVLDENIIFSIAPKFYSDFTKFIHGRIIEGLDKDISIKSA